MEIEIYRDAEYRRILELQRERFTEMVDRRRRGLPVEREWLMAVEHRPVYTLGRHGNSGNLLNPEMLRREGIDLVEIERGGDITFHGPGQVVVYPLIDLSLRGLGVKGYVNLLEEAVIRTVAEWGVKAERDSDAPGVWIRDDSGRLARKICALGIKCSRYIAMHGVALNVSTDLRYFQAINPCGFTDRPATSLVCEIAASGAPIPTWDAVAAALLRYLDNLLA